MSNSLRPHGLSHARLLCPWNSPGQNTGVELFPSPGYLPNPGVKPRSPTLQADSLLSEPRGKSRNTGVGSLSLLQGIFSSQDSNQGLLHCRQIVTAELSGGAEPRWEMIKKHVPSSKLDSSRCGLGGSMQT